MRFPLAAAVLTLAATFSGSVFAQSLSPEEQRLVELINVARSEAGLSELQADPQLSAVARGHSADMAENQFFSHISPTTGDVGQRLNTAGVPYRSAGENIALDATVDAAHQAFMNSPAHRANVLNPDFTNIGIGVVQVGNRVMVTEAFTRPRASQPAQAPAPQAAPPAAQAQPQAPEPAPTTRPEEQPQQQPNALPSPFDALSRIIDGASGQTADQTPAQPSEAPRAERPENPEPGIWIVNQDGSWHRVNLDADALLRLLSAF